MALIYKNDVFAEQPRHSNAFGFRCPIIQKRYNQKVLSLCRGTHPKMSCITRRHMIRGEGALCILGGSSVEELYEYTTGNSPKQTILSRLKQATRCRNPYNSHGMDNINIGKQD